MLQKIRILYRRLMLQQQALVGAGMFCLWPGYTGFWFSSQQMLATFHRAYPAIFVER
jgi:hypothetical protein